MLKRWAYSLFTAWVLAGAAQAAEPTEQAVTLVTPTGTLHGTEVLPADAGGAVPLVLFRMGSGPTDRDGNSAMLPGKVGAFRQLADTLARAGIASVRYDKRGIGQSAKAMGLEADLRLDTYADDLAAWIQQLRGQHRFSRIIVAGHSEGSLIAMLAARKAGADGLVSIAGIAHSADQVLLWQLKSKLPAALYAQAEQVVQALKKGQWVDDVPADLQVLFRRSVQPYLVSYFQHTPAEELAALQLPVLVLQGTSDIQVQPGEARALAAANPRARLVLITGMNHLLKMVGDDPALQRGSYTGMALPVSEQLVAELIAFVKP